MIVAAHQPNFLPWLGFFDKMRRADLFVIVDHVQFERQGFQNRTRIKTGEGPRWITVPVQQRSRDERICDKLLDNRSGGKFRWGRKLFLTIKYAYQGTPYFSEYAPMIQDLLDREWQTLFELNLRAIELCREALDIRTPILRSSELGLDGMKSEMVMDLCRKTGANVYLCGTGASAAYLDQQAFAEAGIRVEWQEFAHPRYLQLPRVDVFVEKLSALDLLFNCGAQSARVLRGAPVEVTKDCERWKATCSETTGVGTHA